MSKLTGTSVAKLSDFIDNLKKIAGNCSLTRTEYDYSPEKICSYSHINKLFHLTWNSCLQLADIPVGRSLPMPIKQGRKMGVKPEGKEVECLYCLNFFISYNKFNRICRNCKSIINEQDSL